ncbi:hypothetical protein [Crateriforma conspicua]|uniref:Uncharacterized protein n=1 Tax=Crateriforma conspicua TaxID=2527996 RepID=A0A5C5XTJ1_9PLAN|nr:hypothetical protein [Crateriforma conspicua]TWT65663.1 hypothetical protein Pan14r_52120 [Crateriforma conspicua]
MSDDRPLITAAEERTAEIHARCVTVERACRAIGFTADSSHERIATLIARVAGLRTLRRTIAEIAADDQVGCSERQVRRAMDELVAFGIIERTAEDPPKVRRRGRTPVVWLLGLRWDFLHQTVAEADQAEAISRGEVVENRPSEPVEIDDSDLRTFDRRGADIKAASCGHLTDIGRTFDRHRPKHSLCPNPIPHSPGPQSLSKADVDLDVDHSRSQGQRIRPGPDRPPDSPTPEPPVAVTRQATEPTALRLMAALRHPAGNVRTVWQVAAAFDAGLVSEFAIADAARAAVLMRAGDRVAYFRTTLAERCETDLAGLAQLLRRVRMTGGFPTSPPQRPEHPRPTMRSAGEEPRVPVHDRQRELATQLAAELGR